MTPAASPPRRRRQVLALLAAVAALGAQTAVTQTAAAQAAQTSAAPVAAPTAPAPAAPAIPDAVMLPRVYGGADGESHLDVIALPRTGGEPGRSVQSRLYATDVEIGDSLPGGFIDWHGVSTPRLLVVLAGQLEVGFGDGSKRVLSKGDMVLAADVTGRGHTSRLIGAEPLRMMTIRLRAEDSLAPKTDSCPDGMARRDCVSARLDGAKK